MIELTTDAYLWTKAIHVIGVIAWMAGLLYLPRLYVDHSRAEAGSATSETFKTMERRLLKAIMAPAAVIAVVAGGVMAADPQSGLFALGWGWVKLAAAVGMLIMHVLMIAWGRAFQAARNRHPERFFRAHNEVPPVLRYVRKS